MVKQKTSKFAKLAKMKEANNADNPSHCAMIVKYTMQEHSCIERIKKLFTTETIDYSVYLSKNGKTTFLQSASKAALENFKEDGYTVSTEEHVHNLKKYSVEGIAMDIEAFVPNNYNSGVIVRIAYDGADQSEINAKRDRIEAKFQKILEKHMIPLDRVCIDSTLSCEMLWKKSENSVFGEKGKVGYASVSEGV